MLRSVLLLVFVSSALGLRCAYIHGQGVVSADPIYNLQSFPDYWGSIEEYTSSCTEHFFVKQDTVSYTWNNVTLQQTACFAALGRVGRGMINDTVIFTHSMGNLILAAAIMNGYCELGPTAFWFSSAPPFLGSPAVDKLEGFCNGSQIISPITRPVADLLHFCVGSHICPALRSCDVGYPGLMALAAFGQKNVKGGMCGTDAWGVLSIYSAGLELVSQLFHLPKPNDALVPFTSCSAGAPPNAQWGHTDDSPYYMPKVNHADCTCRNGDSPFGNDRKPCSWYGKRAAQAANAIKLMANH